MKKIILILLFFVSTIGYSQVYHIKSDLIKRHYFDLNDTLYHLDSILNIESEFFLLEIDNNYSLYFKDTDNLIKNVPLDAAFQYDNKNIIIVDSYAQNTRFVYDKTKRKIALYVVFNNIIKVFDWYLEFDNTKIKEISEEKFNKTILKYNKKVIEDFEKNKSKPTDDEEYNIVKL